MGIRIIPYIMPILFYTALNGLQRLYEERMSLKVSVVAGDNEIQNGWRPDPSVFTVRPCLCSRRRFAPWPEIRTFPSIYATAVTFLRATDGETGGIHEGSW